MPPLTLLLNNEVSREGEEKRHMKEKALLVYEPLSIGPAQTSMCAYSKFGRSPQEFYKNKRAISKLAKAYHLTEWSPAAAAAQYRKRSGVIYSRCSVVVTADVGKHSRTFKIQPGYG